MAYLPGEHINEPPPMDSEMRRVLEAVALRIQSSGQAINVAHLEVSDVAPERVQWSLLRLDQGRFIKASGVEELPFPVIVSDLTERGWEALRHLPPETLG